MSEMLVGPEFYEQQGLNAEEFSPNGSDSLTQVIERLPGRVLLPSFYANHKNPKMDVFVRIDTAVVPPSRSASFYVAHVDRVAAGMDEPSGVQSAVLWELYPPTHAYDSQNTIFHVSEDTWRNLSPARRTEFYKDIRIRRIYNQ